MSKLLGKLRCQTNAEKVFDLVLVRYIKSTDSFEFQAVVAKTKELKIFKIKSDVVIKVANERGDEDFLFKFSVGYKNRPKMTDPWRLMNREMDEIANMIMKEKEGKRIKKELLWSDSCSGRRYLIARGYLDSDESFLDLCMIQYLCCFNISVLNEVFKQWKRKKWGRSPDRWVKLKFRQNIKGRKRGAVSEKRKEMWSESEEDFCERIAHNKKAAVLKGYLGWYLDACREECAHFGRKFDRNFWISVWKVEREGKSDLT